METALLVTTFPAATEFQRVLPALTALGISYELTDPPPALTVFESELIDIFQEVIMLDQAIITFTSDEHMQIKRIVLDRDAPGALAFMKIIDKRCERFIIRQDVMKNTFDA
ncbi:MAG: hypothetical protein M0P74_17135 [Syntrophales bacterium]|jgi:hypothetical protein|nr:hypothetical protein [Syntrophales bacterium]